MDVTTKRQVIDDESFTLVFHQVFVNGVEVGAAYEHPGYVNFEYDHHCSKRFKTLQACVRWVRARQSFGRTAQFLKALSK